MANVNALAPFASPVLRLRLGLQMVAKCNVMRLKFLSLFPYFFISVLSVISVFFS
jgi:hypothetical protein